MTRRFELQSKNRKSFYGKCYVEEDGNTVTLYSYNTPVMTLNCVTRALTKYSGYNYSATTKRHQKAFCEFYNITEKELENII